MGMMPPKLENSPSKIHKITGLGVVNKVLIDGFGYFPIMTWCVFMSLTDLLCVFQPAAVPGPLCPAAVRGVRERDQPQEDPLMVRQSQQSVPDSQCPHFV